MDHYNPELGLSDEALARIASVLAAPVQKQHMIRAAADIYSTLTAQSSNASGRGTKADLRRAAKQVKRAADALENLPLQTSLFASLAKVEARVVETHFLHRQRAILPELRWLHEHMENWGSQRRSAIPDQDIPMAAALSFLDGAYLATTGRRPTHSYHRDGDYTGRPLSEFGRFVVAFFREVDPGRTETSLSTSIRTHLSKEGKTEQN